MPARFTLSANDCPILQKNSLKWLAMSVGLSTFTSPTLITLGADEFDNFEGNKLINCFPQFMIGIRHGFKFLKKV